jgi:hypothetical protein
MSNNPAANENEEQHRIRKYLLEKLDSYAHKSRLWQIVHASHVHRNLLKKSRHVSRLHSISEDLVRQCISQLLSDVDQYVNALYQLISSEQLDDLSAAFQHSDEVNSVWHAKQLERARQLLEANCNNQLISGKDVLENYYQYVQNKLTPKNNDVETNLMAKCRTNAFDLNAAYAQAECQAREYLKTAFHKPQSQNHPHLNILDEMIKLGRLILWKCLFDRVCCIEFE